MDREIAGAYVRENFHAGDRLATLLLNKRTDSVIQRLAAAEKVAAPDFQSWLTHQNSRGYDIYISMNALRPRATGRTKADVSDIRHVYLDFDDHGTAAVEALLKRDDLPKPNYLVNSSPDKWQVVWKVEDFGKEQAEELQRNLVRDTGADPAATDCARVLRLPGFYNHKYAKPHLVCAERHADTTYRPEHFPKMTGGERISGARTTLGRRSNSKETLSQSERDWAFAKRALARGESPALIAGAIATHRRYDKADPQYYANLTVAKAQQALQAEQGWERR
jgi:hypothetical protein